MEEESEKTYGSDPLRRFGSGLRESAREEFCQPLWIDKYLFIDLSTWTIVCAVRHGIEGVQCREIRFGTQPLSVQF
jgi:hypothetical protein